MKPNLRLVESWSDIPFSNEAESQILGALMTNNELVDRLAFLKAEHFHNPLHQRIFTALSRETLSGRLATPATLRPVFDHDPDLTEDKNYLGKCLAVATVVPLEMARHLVELHQRRELSAHCEDLQSAIKSGTGSATDHAFSLIEKCEKLIDGESDFKIRDGEQVCQAITDELKAHRQPVSTGMLHLDEAMDGGLHKSKSYGFAARKKVGKTILAGTISYNLAIRGVKHLFVCGEMSPEEIHQRTLARVGKFHSSAFRSEYSKTESFNNAMMEAVNWQQRNILYSNSPGLTFEKLRRTVLRAIIQHRISGFILDYWQLVGGKEARKSTAEHLDEVAQWIADTCRKHRIWSITMAQINQEGNTRGGEGMRLAFDQVYQIHRQSPDEKSPYVWMEMLDTRYTKWANIGVNDNPIIHMNDKGPFFEEIV